MLSRKKVVRYVLSSLAVILGSKRDLVLFVLDVCMFIYRFCLSVNFLPFVAIDLYVSLVFPK